MEQDHDVLSEALQRFLSKRYTDVSRRKIVGSEAGWSPEVWKELADLGFLGAFVSEHNGGLGIDPSQMMSIMEGFGRHLVVEPFVSTAVIGGSLFSELQNREAADALSSGTMRLALANAEGPFALNRSDIDSSADSVEGGFRLSGHKIVVRDAPSATHLIVSARIRDASEFALFLVPANVAQVSLDRYRLIDGTPAADVRLQDAIVPKLALLTSGKPALAVLSQVLNAATVAVCGEAIGVMRAMLEQTIAYACQRTQFGKRLADFQVLQHRMAEMFIEIEQASSLTYRAFLSRNDPSAVSAAKIRVNRALLTVSHEAVQLHGAIGTTEEISLSQYFRRAVAIEREYGSSTEHYHRFEQGLLQDIQFVADYRATSAARRRSDGQRYSVSI